MYVNGASTQNCHNYTPIHGLESWQNRKNHEKITGKMVRPSAKMKTSTNVNQGKTKHMRGFCLNHYLASRC